MNKFGTVKSKILHKITEAYASGDKKEIKNILTTVRENSDFTGLYLFYEHIESKYFEEREDARVFVNAIIPLLQSKQKSIKSTTKVLSESLKDVVISENDVYNDLEVLSEADTLLNVDKKIIAKLRLVEHLTTKKEVKESNIPIIENEALLHTVLANNFNVLYDHTLTEEDKKELSDLLAITNKDLQTNFKTLQEVVGIKLNSMLVVETDELKPILTQAITEANSMKPSKLNYYKLQQLKKGL